MRPGKLFLFAVLIRVLFFILALLADNLSPDYDNSMMAEVPSSASLQNNNNESEDSYTNTRVFTILDPLMRWDAVHFRHIAKFGYTHEHMCAFFPQTPNIFKAFGLIDGDVYKNNKNKINKYFETFPSPPPIVNELLFVTFHIFCFAFATLFLRSILLSLTDRVNKSNRQNNLSQSGMMRPSLLVWLINPASIFFTAAYTETYFALVAFAGMFCIEKLHYYSGYKSYSEFGNNNKNALENNDQSKNQESSTSSLPVRISEKDLTDEQLRGRSPSPMSPTAAARKKLTQKGRRVSIEEREEHNNNNESDDSSSNSSTNKNNQQEKDKTSSEVISFARSFTWAVAAGMCFFVATTLRSNGILLAGFLIHFAVCRLWFVDHFVKMFRRFGLLTGIEEENTNTIKKHEQTSSSSGVNEKRRKSSLAPIQKLALSFICVGLAYMVTIPYQNHINMCHKTFCQDNEKYHQVSKIPRDTDLVCHPQKGVSGFYSGIQRKYWKVGLFEYFTPNNIPNFFIAAPTFLFVLIGLYFRIFFSNSASSQTKNKIIRSKISETLSSIISWISSLEGCHIVYLLAQLTFAFLTMNVQVVTRFVAASPALYYLYGELLWKCTILTECSTGKLIEPYVFESFENDDRKLQSVRRFAKILKPLCCGFVLVWAAVGTAMFPNFMPWT